MGRDFAESCPKLQVSLIQRPACYRGNSSIVPTSPSEMPKIASVLILEINQPCGRLLAPMLRIVA